MYFSKRQMYVFGTLAASYRIWPILNKLQASLDQNSTLTNTLWKRIRRVGFRNGSISQLFRILLVGLWSFQEQLLKCISRARANGTESKKFIIRKLGNIPRVMPLWTPSSFPNSKHRTWPGTYLEFIQMVESPRNCS